VVQTSALPGAKKLDRWGCANERFRDTVGGDFGARIGPWRSFKEFRDR